MRKSASALRLVASFLLLIAICACGQGARERAEPAVAPAAPEEVTALPEVLLPMLAGGEVQPREPDESTLVAYYPRDRFEQTKSHVQGWLVQRGWTLVPGSETDSERIAADLEELGQPEAAALARQSPSFGASYQRGDQTVAVVADQMDQEDPRTRLMLTWF